MADRKTTSDIAKNSILSQRICHTKCEKYDTYEKDIVE